MTLPIADYQTLPERPEEQPKKLPGVLLGVGVVTISTMLVVGILLYAKSQPTSLGADAVLAPLAQNQKVSGNTAQKQPGVPTKPRVAGAGSAQKATAYSEFGAVAQANVAPPPPLGVAQECAPQELFTIGEPETSPTDHPADELNWSGALDMIGEYSNPFVVGSMTADQFPWRTTSDNPDTLTTTIVFRYAGTPASGLLTLGWSPGKQGEKTKKVYLDGILVGATPSHQGTLAGGWWEQMPRVTDTLGLEVTTGEHTLTIEHLAGYGSDAAVWDFITLALTECKM